MFSDTGVESLWRCSAAGLETRGASPERSRLTAGGRPRAARRQWRSTLWLLTRRSRCARRRDASLEMPCRCTLSLTGQPVFLGADNGSLNGQLRHRHTGVLPLPHPRASSTVRREVEVPAPREQMQDKTGINGTDTDPLGRERNRDKTRIHCTLIGSQSPSRTANSSMVPRHYSHYSVLTHAAQSQVGSCGGRRGCDGQSKNLLI